MQIRQLTKADAGQFWKFRLLALTSAPTAFGDSVAEHEQQTAESFANRLEAGPGSFVLGAFQGSELIGTAGFYREPRAKHHHTGIIWGVFVASANRGQKIGHMLVAAIIERARTLPGVEKVQLTVSAAEPYARNLYVSLGFKTYGVEPRAMFVDGRYFDEDRMFLDLTQRL
jgi:RimJ/RimL family protein N-acetyltransferase